MKRLRRILKSLPLRLAALFLALLLAAALALWLARAPLATALTERLLADYGVADPQLTVHKLGLDTLEIRAVALDTPHGAIAIESLELRYRLKELWQQRRFQSLTLSGASATFDLAAFPEDEAAVADDAPPPTLESLLAPIDLRPLAPLPFDTLELRDSTLVIRHTGQTFPLDLQANASASRPDTLAFEASLGNDEAQLGLEGSLSTPETSTLNASLRLAAPIASLQRHFPQGLDLVPETATLAAGPLTLGAALSPNEDAPATLDLRLSAEDLALDYEDLSVRIPKASVVSTLQRLDQASGRLSLAIERLSYDTFELDPNPNLDLVASYSSDGVVEIQLQHPSPWQYEFGYASGSSSFSLRYNLNASDTPLHGSIETSELSVSDFNILPVAISFEGDHNALSYQASPLQLATHDLALTDLGRGTLHLTEEDDAPITLTYQSVADAAALPHPWPGASLPRFELSLASKVFDDRTRTVIDLDSIEAASLASIPEQLDLGGTLQLHLDLTEDDQTERYTGEARLRASNISIQSPDLQGEGIQATAIIQFDDLASDLAEADPLDAEALATELATRIRGSLEWQANRVQADTVEAQWAGGSLHWQPGETDFEISSSASVGILSAATLRLEQIFLESAHSGTPQGLSGTTRLQSLFEGVPVDFATRQQLNTPFSEPSLTGEYTLAPLTFEHSDLAARLVPELAGLSFSALLQAKGTYRANRDGADASLVASLSEGSVSYPPSQVTASGLTLQLSLDSLAQLESGDTQSTASLALLEAGDLRGRDASLSFRLREGQALEIDAGEVYLFGGRASLQPTLLPLDGSDFRGEIALERLSLDEISQYIEIFEGRMEGAVSGRLPFARRDGQFELLRGDLALPTGQTATLRYPTEGLLTGQSDPAKAPPPSFSDRLLTFLGIEPEAVAEQALGNITIDEFAAELFPEDTPETPLRIRISGTAHSDQADIPVVITTRVHGSLSELYNFIIRLNSL